MIKRLFLTGLVTLAAISSHAAQTPRAGVLDKRVTSVVYQPNNVVKVAATYGISTMIIFDEDEEFETISLGDTESWQVAPSEKGNILFVKPVARNVATNMNVVTTRRIYFLELTDHAPDDQKQVFGISFIYPEKDLNKRLRKQAERRAAYPNISNLDRANVNIDYSFSGDAALRPSLVFDDGKKTFFQFEKTVPAIFAVQADFSETLRNFRKEGDYVVVDGVATQYTLRDGNRWTCIFNLSRPDFSVAAAGPLAPVKETRSRPRARSGNR